MTPEPNYDFVKLFLASIALVSLCFNIFLYLRSAPRFKLNIHRCLEVNSNGEGTYLAGIISISNIGKAPAYFSGLQINQTDGDYYYPVSSIESGTKIEPGQTVQGAIPVGHLLGNNAKELIVLDGVWKKYKIRNRQLSQFLRELETEKLRLESNGYQVHPNSSRGA